KGAVLSCPFHVVTPNRSRPDTPRDVVLLQRRQSALIREDDVVRKIVGIIRTLDCITPEIAAKITPETNITRDLSLDSIAVMDFIMELETAYDTVIPLETVAEIATVSDLARALGGGPARTAA